jgi:hypothetical protein
VSLASAVAVGHGKPGVLSLVGSSMAKKETVLVKESVVELGPSSVAVQEY